MKCKVKLTYEVELFVEGNSEDEIMDWLYATTPLEAKDLAYENGKIISENYDEEIMYYVRDDSEVDYVIKGDE